MKPTYAGTDLVDLDQNKMFEPAYPHPLQRDPSFLKMMVVARRNLIGGWTVGNYRAVNDSFRILLRQVVIVNDPKFVRHVFVTRHSNFERKSPQMRRALEALLGDGLFISDGETWSRRRPLVSDIVHKRRLPEFGATMEHAALTVADEWEALPDETEVEITEEMGRLTAAIISQAVFGRGISRDDAQQVIEGFSCYQRSSDPFNLGYFLGADEGWPAFGSRRRRRAIAMVHRVVDEVVSAHLAGEGDAGSMVDLLIRRNQKSGRNPLDLTALRNEAATIFMAGHETTAATLTWAWYLIANATWVADSLHREIEAVCGGRAPRLADLPQLKWCRAVIQETLRLYPPVPLLPRQAKEADRIGHIEVEKSALVIIAPWLLHRSPDLWDKPNHFMPERFMSGARIDPFAYIPFAAGPRICPGMNFGLDEATLCLAILAQRFKVVPRAGYKIEPVCRLTLRPKGGLPAQIVKRSPRTGI